MPAASRSSAPARWRTVSLVVICTVAGGLLRRALFPPNISRTSPHSAAAPPSTPSRALSLPRLTIASLSSLSPRQQILALAACLPDMSVGEIAPLAASFAASRNENWRYPSDPVKDAMLRALFTRWVELDATGMLTELKRHAWRFSFGSLQLAVSAWTEFAGLSAFKAVAQQWPALSQNAAWELMAREPAQMDAIIPWLGSAPNWSFPGSDEDLQRLVGTERFVRIAAAMGDQGRAIEALRAIDDEAWQRRAALALPPSRIRDEALMRLGLGSTAGEFRANYESLPPGRSHDAFAGNYAALLEEETPGAGMAWSRTLTNGTSRGAALSGIATAILSGTHLFDESSQPSALEPADPFATVLVHPPDYLNKGSQALAVFAEAWSADPAGQAESLRTALEGWRVAAPQAAEAWLQTAASPALRDALSPPIIRQDPWDRDPSLPVEAEGTALATRLTESLKSGDSAAEWTSLAEADRQQLSGPVMKYFAEHLSPEKTLTFFDSLAPEERTLTAWYEAARVRSASDLKAASMWVDSLPWGSQRDAATTALVERLTTTEPESPGLFEYASSVARPPFYEDRNPEAAFTWAASMSGEAERTRYMMQAARAWALQDVAAARAAVSAAAQLPPSVRDSLLSQLAEGGPP